MNEGEDVGDRLVGSNWVSGRRRGSRLRFAGMLVLLLWWVVGCAVPGRLYLAVPVISGSLRGDAILSSETRLRRVVIHRENPMLNQRSEVALSPTGVFSFEAVEFKVAGREYSKSYRVFLHIQNAKESRVIWRATLSRQALAGPIALDCDLDRPAPHGQPCWVREPTQQPWHVAEGKRTFERLCAGCHGANGSGKVSRGTPTDGRPPDLREISLRRGGRFDRALVAEWIEGRSLPVSHGTRTMPVWGESLSDEYERYVEGDELIGAELDPVLAYLESLQRTSEPEP
jgi:hypothetical protein